MNPAQHAARQILAEISGRAAATIGPHDRLSELGLDSLDRLVLAVLVEQRCGRELSDQALVSLATVSDLDHLLEAERKPV